MEILDKKEEPNFDFSDFEVHTIWVKRGKSAKYY